MSWPATRCGGERLAGSTIANSVAARIADDSIAAALDELAGQLWICQVGRLEQLYSTKSAHHYDALIVQLDGGLFQAEAPPDVLDRAIGYSAAPATRRPGDRVSPAVNNGVWPAVNIGGGRWPV